MLGAYVLTLFCLTCQPMTVTQIKGIPPWGGLSLVGSELGCMEMGAVLSGDFARMNMQTSGPRTKIAAKKYWIVYTCKYESGDL